MSERERERSRQRRQTAAASIKVFFILSLFRPPHRSSVLSRWLSRTTTKKRRRWTPLGAREERLEGKRSPRRSTPIASSSRSAAASSSCPPRGTPRRRGASWGCPEREKELRRVGIRKELRVRGRLSSRNKERVFLNRSRFSFSFFSARPRPRQLFPLYQKNLLDAHAQNESSYKPKAKYLRTKLFISSRK